MKKSFAPLFTLLISLCFLLPLVSAPAKLVNNLSKKFPSFLSTSEEAHLEEKLRKFNQETSNQICIVITDSFSGAELGIPLHALDANSFSTELFNKWGIGQKEKDNGLLILIKPTTEDGGRQVYINVGYGLEAAVTDLQAKEIINKILIPNFKAGQNYQALSEATDALMKLAGGEFNEKLANKKTNKPSPLIFILLIPALFIIFSELFLSKTGKQLHISKDGSRRYRSHNYFPLPYPWLHPGSGNTFRDSHSSGDFNLSNLSDFGGFGGGSSGGGGAGGSW